MILQVLFYAELETFVSNANSTRKARPPFENF